MKFDTCRSIPHYYVREKIRTQIATSGITAICCYTEGILKGANNCAWTGTSKSYLQKPRN